MRRPSKDQAGQTHQWHQSPEEQLAGTHTRRHPSRCRCGQEEARGAAGPSWSHRLGARCGLQKQGLGAQAWSAKPDDQVWKLPLAAAHCNTVPAPAAVGLHREQRGPWEVWEEPHSQAGQRGGDGHRGESESMGISRSHWFSAQCSPTPGTWFWKPTAFGQELSEWLSSGRPDIRKTPLLGVPALGHKDRSSHPSPISEVPAPTPACGHQAPGPGSRAASAAETSPFQTEASPCGKQE